MLSLILIALPLLANANEVQLQPILDDLDNPEIHMVGFHISAYHNNNVPHKDRMGHCEYCTKCPDFSQYATTTNFQPCPQRLQIFVDNLKKEYDYLQDSGDRFLSEYFGFASNKLFTTRRVHHRNGDFFSVSQHLVLEMNITSTILKMKSVEVNQTVPLQGVDRENNLSFEYEDNRLFMNFLQGQTSINGWGMGVVTETSKMETFIPGLPRKRVFLNKLYIHELKRTGCTCIRNKMGNFRGTIYKLEELCRSGLNAETEELRESVQLWQCTTNEEKKNMGKEEKLVQEQGRMEL